MQMARCYLVRVLLHLPDFFAPRATSHFDNNQRSPNSFGLPTYSRLHLRETMRRDITFSDGKEVADPLSKVDATSG